MRAGARTGAGSRGFKPTIFLVGLLTFLSALVSMMLGLVYFFAYASFGNSEAGGEAKIGELSQHYAFWRRKNFDFAVIDAVSAVRKAG